MTTEYQTSITPYAPMHPCITVQRHIVHSDGTQTVEHISETPVANEARAIAAQADIVECYVAGGCTVNREFIYSVMLREAHGVYLWISRDYCSDWEPRQGCNVHVQQADQKGFSL